jgi:fluoride exporter
MKVFWAVAVGAALGGLSRFYLGSFIQQRTGADFPAGTLIVNITGSFLVGVIMRMALQSDLIGPETRTLLTTGFCGGYTTFSAFSYETVLMLEDGKYWRAAVYVGLSVGVAVAATFLGFAVANLVIPRVSPLSSRP